VGSVCELEIFGQLILGFHGSSDANTFAAEELFREKIGVDFFRPDYFSSSPGKRRPREISRPSSRAYALPYCVHRTAYTVPPCVRRDRARRKKSSNKTLDA
jgi:hypothetical protein